jgi:cytochrome P450
VDGTRFPYDGVVPDSNAYVVGSPFGVMLPLSVADWDRAPPECLTCWIPEASVFPLGAATTLADLEQDPHPHLARLRASEPVSWVPVLDGWLVTRHDLAVEAMRDAGRFTVDDPRFSTAQVVGPSMLSLDGHLHDEHRRPFAPPFRPLAVRERFADTVAADAGDLIDAFAAEGRIELRRTFAGPLAAITIARALGVDPGEVPALLRWYEAIVASVTEITGGGSASQPGTDAFDQLHARLKRVIADHDHASLLGDAAADSPLDRDAIVSNAAVVLFGGIETTEGMILNAMMHVLANAGWASRALTERGALELCVEESLRLEPAAAMVDRYATRDTRLGETDISSGDLLHLSITGANRDPSVFAEPDRFDPERPDVRRHLAFAHGPHVCLGVYLARLEATAGVGALLARLPQLRLEPGRRAAARGLVFRKPPELHVVWG